MTKTVLSITFATALWAQASGPATDPPHAGDRNITGTAPGATSLIVYDVSSGGKRYLGNGNSIDKNGNFAVAVNPPLTLSQKIVVVDSQGRSSAPLAVTAPIIPKTPPHLK